MPIFGRDASVVWGWRTAQVLSTRLLAGGFDYDSDPSLTPTDPNYYKGIWITDSDDNKGDPGDAASLENNLVYVGLTWDAANSRYTLSGYKDAPTAYITDVTALDRKTGTRAATINGDQDTSARSDTFNVSYDSTGTNIQVWVNNKRDDRHAKLFLRGSLPNCIVLPWF